MHQKTSFLQQFGPGIIMASSAVGGSHIIASTQAGSKFGLSLGLFIIVVNLLKYPFYRFAYKYALDTNQSVLEGYAQKGKMYLVAFMVFNLFATIVNIAGGTLLSAVLLGLVLPFKLTLIWLNLIVLASFLIMLRKNQYHILSVISKNIMIILSLITLISLVLAFFKLDSGVKIDTFFVKNSFSISTIPFLIALMGWMPSPLELSVSTSLWVVQKNKNSTKETRSNLFDFNTGYTVTIILALMFMALGAFVQFGNGVSLKGGGGFVMQFIDMYALSIGEWTRIFMSIVAFACIYGTTIIAVDGYNRANIRALKLIFNKKQEHKNELFYWIIGTCFISLIVILFFKSSVKDMILFAMTMSFVSAPVFAWLNFSLYLHGKKTDKFLVAWASVGLIYLLAMVVLYFWAK